MKNRTLNQIFSDFIELEETANPETGEIDQEIEKELNNELANKIDSFGHYIVMAEKEVEGLKIISESYKAKAESKEKEIENNKKRYASAVSMLGSVEISKTSKKPNKWLRGDLISLKDTSKWDIVITDKKAIPNKFLKSYTTYTPNNSLLKAEIIDNKKDVEGVVKKYIPNIQVTGLKKLKEDEN